ncbi:MAG: hypothetical protein WC523_00850 [Patescibacteria group bacterium]
MIKKTYWFFPVLIVIFLSGFFAVQVACAALESITFQNPSGTITGTNYSGSAASVNGKAIGATTDGKWCTYNAASTSIICNTDAPSFSGLTTLNTLTSATQTFATGSAGADFGISSSGTTHTFNIPTASASNRGLLSATDWATFNNKASGNTANWDAAYTHSTNVTGGVHGAIAANTANMIVRRDASGNFSAGAITASLVGKANTAGDADSVDGVSVGGQTAGGWCTYDSANTRINCSSSAPSFSGVTTLNTLTSATQTFATGSAGADFGISSSGTTHTFNIPTASASNRGLLSATDWATFNNKASGNTANWDAAYTHSTNVTGGVHGAIAANTANMIVRRDASGNFSAGAITASLVGKANTAGDADSVDGVSVGGQTAGGWCTYDSANTRINCSSSAPSFSGVTGSGTDNYIPRWNGTTALENSVIYDNGTNVGIGTTDPVRLLDVYGSSSPIIGVTNTGGSGGAAFKMNDVPGSSDWFFKATSAGFKIRDNTNALDVVVIEKAAAANALYIKAGGNVGIGTTAPGQKLDVDGNIRANYTLYLKGGNNMGGTVGGGIAMSANGNNYGLDYLAYAAQTASSGIGVTFSPNGTPSLPYDFQFGTNEGTSLLIIGHQAAKAHVIAADNTSASANPWDLILRSPASGHGWSESAYNSLVIKAGAPTNTLYLNSSGNVGIGTTAPAQKLQVNGYAQADSGFCIGTNCITSWSAAGLGGSGTNNYISRWDGTDSLKNSIIYDDTTNVGIGLTNPSARLHVSGNLLVNSAVTFSTLGSSGNNALVFASNDGTLTSVASTSVSLPAGAISHGTFGSNTSDTGKYAFPDDVIINGDTLEFGEVGVHNIIFNNREGVPYITGQDDYLGFVGASLYTFDNDLKLSSGNSFQVGSLSGIAGPISYATPIGISIAGGIVTYVNSVSGLSQTVVVRGSTGSNCNLVFSGGVLTSTTCP